MSDQETITRAELEAALAWHYRRDDRASASNDPAARSKPVNRKTILAAACAAGVLALTGCGSFVSSSLQNAAVNREVKNGQVVGGNRNGPVTRFDTPGHFPAITRICDGTEGLYVSESSTGIVTVVPDDPGCGYKGPAQGANSTVGPAKSDTQGK